MCFMSVMIPIVRKYDTLISTATVANTTLMHNMNVFQLQHWTWIILRLLIFQENELNIINFSVKICEHHAQRQWSANFAGNKNKCYEFKELMKSMGYSSSEVLWLATIIAFLLHPHSFRIVIAKKENASLVSLLTFAIRSLSWSMSEWKRPHWVMKEKEFCLSPHK